MRATPAPLLRALHDELLERMGPQGWWPADGRFEMMLGAVLVQHTRWENAVLSIARLREAGLLDPASLAAAEPEALVPLLRRSGFMLAKGRACIGLARWTVEVGGEHDPLAQLDDAALRASLLALTGIGPETADVIALYGFDRPILIADAYAWRLLTALGHDVPRPYEALRRSLAPHVEAASLSVHELQELHALIDEFGRLAARDPGLLDGLRQAMAEAASSVAPDAPSVLAADDRRVDRSQRATQDHSGANGLDRSA